MDQYFSDEIQPHLPDAWMDRSKDKIGYEINFTKYFYKYEPLRSVDEILMDMTRLDQEISSLVSKVKDE